ncbi:MAG: T9SS type A sorting domain-containing protein [Saprospiraceae bacterium]
MTSVIGQTFSPTPAPLVQEEIGLELANVVFLYFENLTNDSLQLRWRRMEESLPDGWNADLCDYGACYIGVPGSGYMNPAPPGVQPYLKLIVQPGLWAGDAWYWFRVYNAADQTEFHDVFFSLHTPGITTVQTVDRNTGLKLFPNPAHHVLSVQNSHNAPRSFQLVDPAGNMRRQATLASGAQWQVDVSAWPAGLYNLSTPPYNIPFLIVH